MEVDASRMHASLLSSYPPPQQSFDSYTLPSRAWPYPHPQPSSCSYIPTGHTNMSRDTHYTYRGGEPDMYHSHSPSMIPIQHASTSNNHSPVMHPTAHSPQYSIPPESWSAPVSLSPPLPPITHHHQSPMNATAVRREARRGVLGEAQRAPNAALLYAQSQAYSASSSLALLSQTRLSASQLYASSSSSIPRLPPILQVEKQQVTTSATQAASASRRRNEANFTCPVPGCGSTFTRRFNLRGHLRSHTEERPFVCEWPGCNKGFARQHDCKRHQALHTSRSQTNICQGCGKTFSRLDALNRHLRSEGGAECRQTQEAAQIANRLSPNLSQSTKNDEDWDSKSASSSDRGTSIPVTTQ